MPLSEEALPFNAPATPARVAGLLERLQLTPGARVLDVGCGRGEMLMMLAERYGCIGVGVDPNEDELAVARQRSPARGQLHWQASTMAEAQLEAPFDAVLCIGATHAFSSAPGAIAAVLQGVAPLLSSGGRVLIGEGFWQQPPPEAYLAATPLRADELLTHEANEALSEDLGFALIHSEVSDAEEWVAFEDGHLRKAEAKLAAQPEDPDLLARAEHWRRWNAAFHRWGRDTMGFGFYLYRSTSSASP